MPFQVEHSGHTLTSLCVAPSEYGKRLFRGGLVQMLCSPVVPIWPIEEYLVRSKHKPSVAARIARLNPNGKPEGEMPRGIHYTPTIRHSVLDGCSRETFEKRWGKGTYRKLPKSAFVPMGGKRRAVSGVAYMEGP